MKKNNLILFIPVICLSFMLQTKPTGLNVGAAAPDFNAKDQNGKTLALKELIKQGPVVLIFYRGEWCPYCNKQLSQLNDSMTYITAKGAKVIAISPETALNVRKTIDKTKATYSIISDEKIKIMSDYKVAFTLDEKTTAKYKEYGIDLTEKNGANGNTLPAPSVYIIDRTGKIAYRHVDEDYTKRVSVKEILAHL